MTDQAHIGPPPAIEECYGHIAMRLALPSPRRFAVYDGARAKHPPRTDRPAPDLKIIAKGNPK